MQIRLRRRTRRLPWPCSRVDRDVLHELWVESQETGRPITAIVADAVTAHQNRRLEQVTRAAEPTFGYDARPRHKSDEAA